MSAAAKIIKGVADTEGTVSVADGVYDYIYNGNVAASTVICGTAFAATLLTPLRSNPIVLTADAACTALVVNEGAAWLRSKIPQPYRVETTPPPRDLEYEERVNQIPK